MSKLISRSLLLYLSFSHPPFFTHVPIQLIYILCCCCCWENYIDFFPPLSMHIKLSLWVNFAIWGEFIFKIKLNWKSQRNNFTIFMWAYCLICVYALQKKKTHSCEDILYWLIFKQLNESWSDLKLWLHSDSILEPWLIVDITKIIANI